MKRMIIVSVVLTLLSWMPASAQVRADTGINISSQPSWGPKGYDYVEYYYIPEIQVYYHVPNRQFIFQAGGRWVFTSELPARYKNFDLFTGYKVVINEPNAYLDIRKHKVKYPVIEGQRNKPLLFRKNNEPGAFAPEQYLRPRGKNRD